MVNAVSAGSPSRLMPTAQAARRNALALKAFEVSATTDVLASTPRGGISRSGRSCLSCRLPCRSARIAGCPRLRATSGLMDRRAVSAASAPSSLRRGLSPNPFGTIAPTLWISLVNTLTL